MYNLDGQLQHKVELIEKFIPDQIKKIYAIGHSVGSRLIVDLLRKSPTFDEKVEKCYLMFPTIERIAQSKSGKYFVAFRPFIFILNFIVSIFNWMPQGARQRMVKWYCRDMPEEFHDDCFEHTKPAVVEKILFMASDEMDKITVMDEETIGKNLHRLKLYYGQKDAWVKTRFYHEIIAKFPGIDAELCSKGFEHAFVLKNSQECGAMVAEWINDNKRK